MITELPGSELILPGLDDLRNGKTTTVGALLVAIAATRLAEAGLDIPKDHLAPEPELTLYDRLQDERSDAYPYYNALLSRLNSFCNALELNKKLRPFGLGASKFTVPADFDDPLPEDLLSAFEGKS